MTIREMQYAIQEAIDKGIADDATLVAQPTEDGTIAFYAVTNEKHDPNGKLAVWTRLGPSVTEKEALQ